MTFPHRFDELDHAYVDLGSGEQLQSVTQMLVRTGWVDDLWFTEESSERGTAVHRMTADYDLGAIEHPASVVSPYKGYLLSHVAAMQVLGVEILHVEESFVNRALGFAGRPDRVIVDRGAKGPLEGKSGAPAKSHPIQTALQALLLEPILHLPAELQVRLCLYWKANGKFKVVEHRERGDLLVAREIVRACTGRG